MAETKSLAPRTSALSSITRPIISFLAALGIGAVFIAAIGKNPLGAYGALLDGAFGTPYRIGETLVAATPLTIMALGIIVAFKASMWNVGGVGQEYLGAITATWVGIYITLPAALHIPLVVLAGFAGGAVWALVPALLRARFKINEIVVTIMMNYIAINFVSFLTAGPMMEPGAWIPWTPQIQASAQLPAILGRLHGDFIIALILVPLVWILLTKTVVGYRIRVVGANEKAAKYAGISTAKYGILAMVISGGLIGIAGMGEIAGLFLRVQPDFSPGYGYTCIPVALLAGLNPLAALPASILFGMLYSGGLAMNVYGVPPFITNVITGTVMILLLVSELIGRRK